MKRSIKRNTMRVWAAGALLALTATHLQAQPIYRFVSPDGRITFSDKPTVASDTATLVGAGGRFTTAGSGADALPYELRQIVSRYPVTLYTGDNCVPCGTGRAFLVTRGIPFSERTIGTAQDAEALQRISGENLLPLLMIGGQQVKGFSDSEWSQFLDAAGYPKTSQLPAGYRHPAPTPLVEVQKPAPVQQAEGNQGGAAPDTGRSSPPPASPSNPAGIRF